jgi:paraquat-inducible protein A
MAPHALTLHRTAGPWSWAFLAALALALALQVAALTLPFVRVSIVLAGAEDYRLTHTVQLMWEAKLYLLAVLIAGFSVIFPFVKIAGIACAWLLMRPGAGRTRLTATLAALGKWSMIDPLAVCLLVVFASDQWAVSADTRPGVICFLAAITVAMALGAIAQHMDRATHPHAAAATGRSDPTHSRAAGTLVRPWSWLLPVMLALSAAAFVTTLSAPLLQIHQFLLSGNAFGLPQAGDVLFAHAQWALGLLVWGGLIIAPAATIVVQTILWAVPASPSRHAKLWHVAATIREWSMLEVFAVALALFLSEGSSFIQTEARAGFWLLLVAIGTQLAANLVAWLAFRRSLQAAVSGTRRAAS